MERIRRLSYNIYKIIIHETKQLYSLSTIGKVYYSNRIIPTPIPIWYLTGVLIFYTPLLIIENTFLGSEAIIETYKWLLSTYMIGGAILALIIHSILFIHGYYMRKL